MSRDGVAAVQPGNLQGLMMSFNYPSRQIIKLLLITLTNLSLSGFLGAVIALLPYLVTAARPAAYLTMLSS